MADESLNALRNRILALSGLKQNLPTSDKPTPRSWLLSPPPESAPPVSNFLRTLMMSRPPETPPAIPAFLLPHARMSPPPPPPRRVSGIADARLIVNALLRRKASVSEGRVLPGVDDIAILQGRRVRAAFVYSDLHGFTKLVATQPENNSFVFLDTFVQMAIRYTKQYGGEVVDCAGDRVLSVFQRPAGDFSSEPVKDAVTFALWLQTVFNKAIAPAFATGLGQLSLGIGIDYGEAVVGCVGIRNNKRIVFFGDAANNAAKLQEIAGPGETVLSAMVNIMAPAYLKGETWHLRNELVNGKAITRITQYFAGEDPPKSQ